MTRRRTFSKYGGRTGVSIVAGLLFFSMAWLSPGFSQAQEAASDQLQFVKVVQSQKSFSATLKAFRDEVGKAGWGILNMHNMAGVLSERGYTIHPVVILDVCSGQYSARILGNDAYRPISVFMPCRVSIYQLSDGKVFVAMMNTGAFAKMMPPEVAEVMSASDAEIGQIIANTVR